MKRPTVRKALAAAAAAAVALFSPGLEGYRAFAQVVEAPLPDAPLPAPTAVQDPSLSPPAASETAAPQTALEPLEDLSAQGPLTVPAKSLRRAPVPQARPSGAAAAARPLLRSSEVAAPALSRLFDSARLEGATVDVPEAPEALPVLAAPEPGPAQVSVSYPRPVEKRSALYPAWFAIGAGLAAFAARAASVYLAAGVSRVGAAVPGPNAVVVGLAALTTLFAAGAVLDLALFAWMKWRGRGVTQERFNRFVEQSYPQYKALIRDFLPSERKLWFTYGFHSGPLIYMRRELAATPWLFKLVMSHELEHFRSYVPDDRGRPRSLAWRTLVGIGREVRAYSKEVLSMRRVPREGLPLLWRASAASQVSWRLSSDFDVLAVDAQRDADLPKTLNVLSNGRARLRQLELRGSLAALNRLAAEGANRGRYRGLVLYGASAWLPEKATIESMLLARAFRQLELVLAEGERRKAAKPQLALDSRIEKAWRHAYGPIKTLGSVRLLENAYGLLPDRGVAVLPFSAGERGLDLYERLLRFYTARDGGRFGVTRVDLAEGGHVLVLRKLEPRVNLWITPPEGGAFPRTLTNVSESAERQAEAWKALEAAGLGKFRPFFEEHRIELRHVFGADRGENRVYVSVPRTSVPVLKKLAATEPDFRIRPSQAGFRPQLYVSGPAVRIDEAHARGYRGRGIRIAGVDTGVDARHPDFQDRIQVKDEVNGGDGDPNGHGTHTMGIMTANGGKYVGMAPEAEGWMGKVFAEGGIGASDGDIMAALSDALDWGADVINMSLGSRGSPNDTLARFVSGLTGTKNSKGRSPVVFASSGNGGPFHQVMSQPAAGPNVNAVSSFVRTKVGGVRLPSFFSSPGFSWDEELKIWLAKPEFGGVGGNVLPTPDLYQDGVESTKSGQKPSSSSDAEDGKHTRMSGTSMASPELAGIAALLLEAAREAEERGLPAAQYVKDHTPLAIRAVLMRTHVDAGVPLPVSLSGLADARAALALMTRTLGLDRPNLAVRLFRRFFGTRAPPEALDWAWVERFGRIQEAGRAPFEAARKARTEYLESLQKEKPDLFPQPAEPKSVRRAKQAELGKAADAAYQKAAADAKAPRLPELIGLLDAKAEPIWSNRMMAAFALLNYKEVSAADALLEAGLNDPDSRVRQMALRALAETPTHRVDPMLKAALQHDRWDVQLYSAMALARHGDPTGLPKLVELMGASGPEGPYARLNAVYAAGELASAATSGIAEALAARVADSGEIDSIRHHAAASLTDVFASKDSAPTDKALLHLLSAAGPQESVLAHTLSRMFAAAGGKPALAARFRKEPLQPKAAEFVQRYREWVTLGGPMADLVRTIAKLAGIRIDVPTPPIDSGGKGVRGVDGRLGPVQLFVRVPDSKPKVQRFSFFRDRPEDVSIQSAAAGLDPAVVERNEGRVRATLPAYNAITLEVPEANRTNLTRELQAQGFDVYAARPVFATLKDTGRLSQMDRLPPELDGEGVTIAIVDEGGDVRHPAFAGRVRAAKNFTDEGGVDDVSSETVGHGTHVGGIAAGEAVEGSPYRGMAPKARLIFAKVLGANGGTDVQVLEGQAWAASQSKDPLKDPILVNESLGGPGTPEDPLSLGANQLVLGNVGFVAAAGNEGPKTGTVGSPANAALSIAVGSVDKEGKLAFYSSREVEGKKLGGWLDFGGGAYFDRENPYEIVSTLSTRLPWGDRATTVWWPGREGGKPLYQYMSGTSQASPHTAGKLAVLVGQMLKAYGGELPAGYILWLRAFVESKMTKSGYGENEQGTGTFRNVAEISAALAQRLLDPAGIRAESAALQDRAVREHGRERTPPGTGSQVSLAESAVEMPR